MAHQVGGKSLGDWTRESIVSALPEMPVGASCGMRVFGGIPGMSAPAADSCQPKESQVPMTSDYIAPVITALHQAQPQGPSSLVNSLLKVPQDLPNPNASADVVVISSGKDGCGGDLDQAAQQLAKTAPNVKFHVVELPTKEKPAGQKESKSPLRQFAEKVGGDYVELSDTKKMVLALRAVVKNLFQSKKVVAETRPGAKLGAKSDTKSESRLGAKSESRPAVVPGAETLLDAALVPANGEGLAAVAPVDVAPDVPSDDAPVTPFQYSSRVPVSKISPKNMVLRGAIDKFRRQSGIQDLYQNLFKAVTNEAERKEQSWLLLMMGVLVIVGAWLTERFGPAHIKKVAWWLKAMGWFEMVGSIYAAVVVCSHIGLLLLNVVGPEWTRLIFFAIFTVLIGLGIWAGYWLIVGRSIQPSLWWACFQLPCVFFNLPGGAFKFSCIFLFGAPCYAVWQWGDFNKFGMAMDLEAGLNIQFRIVDTPLLPPSQVSFGVNLAALLMIVLLLWHKKYGDNFSGVR